MAPAVGGTHPRQHTTAAVPAGDVPPTFVVIVRVEGAELFAGGVTVVGFSTHVVDAGQPLTVRPTALLNPFKEVTVTVELAAFP